MGVDPCKYAGEGDLNYCVDAITLRQAKSGKARLEVKRSKVVAGKKRKLKAISLLSAEKTSITALEIRATWDQGENSIALSKIGNYKGELTLEQDFPFPIACSQTGGASCVHGGSTYNVGDSFPDVDGCNTCSCSAQGITCTEIACAPGCSMGGNTYSIGETFHDGCNTCTCMEHGGMSCTELFCPQR